MADFYPLCLSGVFMGHVILFWCRSYERRSRGCNNFCGPENLGYTLHIFRKLFLLCSLRLLLCYKEFLSHSFFKEIALMKCKETLQTDCLLTKFMMQRNKCQRWHLLEKSQKHWEVTSEHHLTSSSEKLNWIFAPKFKGPF